MVIHLFGYLYKHVQYVTIGSMMAVTFCLWLGEESEMKVCVNVLLLIVRICIVNAEEVIMISFRYFMGVKIPIIEKDNSVMEVLINIADEVSQSNKSYKKSIQRVLYSAPTNFSQQVHRADFPRSRNTSSRKVVSDRSIHIPQTY
jgi:hypothetical protein